MVLAVGTSGSLLDPDVRAAGTSGLSTDLSVFVGGASGSGDAAGCSSPMSISPAAGYTAAYEPIATPGKSPASSKKAAVQLEQAGIGSIT